MGSPPSEWYVGLSTWILQDGNYADFVVGERRQFALEVGFASAEPLRLADRRERAARHTGRGCSYAVSGALVRDAPRTGRGYVLDFGLSVYGSWLRLDDGGVPATPSAGTWVEGEVVLGVDPFLYFDGLARLGGMPPLIYTWEVLGIEQDVSPLVEVRHGDPLYGGPDEGPKQVRDPHRERYVSVDRTRTRDDCLYRLRCALLPVEPTSSLARDARSA